MEIKYTNIDEHGRKYAEAVIKARVMETYTKEDLKNELISCYSFARQEGEVLTKNEFGSFGQAIETLRRGFMVARAGWNGKGMFLYYVPEGAYPARTTAAKTIADADDKVSYGAYIAMKTAQGNVVPWLASQTDMLATDWYLVDVKDATAGV